MALSRLCPIVGRIDEEDKLMKFREEIFDRLWRFYTSDEAPSSVEVEEADSDRMIVSYF